MPPLSRQSIRKCQDAMFSIFNFWMIDVSEAGSFSVKITHPPSHHRRVYFLKKTEGGFAMLLRIVLVYCAV